jgi:hypothetical protein
VIAVKLLCMAKYSSWKHYFQHNTWNPNLICPPGRPCLSAEERDLLAHSLQQFQLGEGSDGHGLMRRAKDFATKRNLPELVEAMGLFIQEEQRHSKVLGQFLDRETIPRIQKHWVDGLFRRIRGLAGFEPMLTVLMIAELIAIPYYSAIHDASDSPVLKQITRRILQDEDQHLSFQADNFAQIVAERNDLGRAFTLAAHWLGLTAAALLVYWLHRKLFQQVRYSPLRFWSMAIEAHKPIFQRLTVNAAHDMERTAPLLH